MTVFSNRQPSAVVRRRPFLLSPAPWRGRSCPPARGHSRPRHSKAASSVILAAEGCGPVWHRGFYGRCRPDRPRICPPGSHWSVFRGHACRDGNALRRNPHLWSGLRIPSALWPGMARPKLACNALMSRQHRLSVWSEVRPVTFRYRRFEPDQRDGNEPAGRRGRLSRAVIFYQLHYPRGDKFNAEDVHSCFRGCCDGVFPVSQRLRPSRRTARSESRIRPHSRGRRLRTRLSPEPVGPLQAQSLSRTVRLLSRAVPRLPVGMALLAIPWGLQAELVNLSE
jgi:hypothetical protein